MKIAFLIILALSTTFNKINAQIGITDLRTGIEIVFVTEEEMFPESWTEGEINGEAGSLSVSERRRSGNIIKTALSKYPASVLNENLIKIYVLEYLKFYDVTFGGTNSNDIVYLTNKGEDNGYTDFYLEQTFHHEFSSILLRNNSDLFFSTKWESVNNDDFVYGKGGVQEIYEDNASLSFEESYHQQGFLHQYAMSGVENDFNSIAENLFCPHPKFWEIYDSYPQIRLKTDLTIKLYHSLNEEFTKQYFLKYKDKPD
ncbi:MAG: hypothetical protein PHW83_02450 [Bacteroidales bacterium]|nr:hypothetical protein [Bacteroidales bacterium]